MSVAIVGAVALDEIHTPEASARDILGGSAIYAALAASLFAPCAIVSIVGDDLPPGTLEGLKRRGIDCGSVTRRAGPGFRWGCRYDSSLELRETLYTRTGAYAAEHVCVTGAAATATHLFLTAGDPDLNQATLPAFGARRLTALDTIEREAVRRQDDLLAMLHTVDLVSLNTAEAAALCDWPGDLSDPRLADVAFTMVREHGADTLLLKRGPAGVELRGDGLRASVPAVPEIRVVDPTGAGDSFGGAVLGALAAGADLASAARLLLAGAAP